jgi:membrane-associated phospholipid phosphatase
VALLAIAMIPFANHVDGTIGRFVGTLPIDPYSAATKQVSNPVTVLLIAATIWLLDRRRRASLAVLLVALLLAIVINEGMKQITGRARPTYGIEMGDGQKKKVISYLKEHPDAPIHPEAVDQWVGLHERQSFAPDPYGSFPSGHANAAFVLATYLSVLYPEAGMVWYFVAVGCGVARIEERRHYTTDVLFGAATGWIIAQIVFSWTWPARLGKRFFERDIRAKIQNS